MFFEPTLSAADSPPDVLDVLVVRPAGDPLRIRLHVNVEDLPFRHHWRTLVLELFKKVDRDKDGKLSDAEKTGLPWPAPEGEVDQQKFLELALANTPPVEVEHAPINPRSASGLFVLLDKNGDGSLTEDELKSAPLLLETRDFDDDGVLSYDELIPPYKPGEPRGAVVVALTPQGTLGADDLKKFGKRLGGAVQKLPTPAAQVWAPLGKTRLRLDAVGSGGVDVRIASDSAFLVAGDLKIEVQRARPDPMRASSTFPPFNSLDRDKNDYLDATELKAILGDQTPGVFKLIDADEDGKATGEEYIRYIRIRDQIRKAAIFVQSTDLGQEMFAAVDADRDGRLTRFELSKAGGLIATLGSDGRIGGKNFPTTVELLVGGASSLRTSGGMRERPRTGKVSEATPSVDRAPTWFHDMDRNRDGVVERSEFLGSSEHFKKCDRNGDGLLVADEAAAAFPNSGGESKPAKAVNQQKPQKPPTSKN